jgi:multidrug efflux pump subunit AcrA (membrane-fusion protein)
MRVYSFLTALILAGLLANGARAEDIIFRGKTASPEKYEVWSLHASPDEMKIYESAAQEVKAKQGEDAEPPIRPFNGRMKIVRVLVNIGQHVDDEQGLLTYTFPPEDLLSEERKISQSDLMHLESSLARVNTDLDLAQTKLSEIRLSLQKGTASTQELQDKIRDIAVLRLNQRVLEDRLKLEREENQGELTLAKAKFGLQARPGHLPSEVNLQSPGAGYVLWINPDLKPGVYLDKKTKLFEVGTMNPLLIKALVHEMLIPKLRVGDKAEVSFESLPGKTYTATISRIPMTTEQTETQLPSHFEVQLTMPNPDLFLKEGLRAQVQVRVPDGPRTDNAGQ